MVLSEFHDPTWSAGRVECFHCGQGQIPDGIMTRDRHAFWAMPAHFPFAGRGNGYCIGSGVLLGPIR